MAMRIFVVYRRLLTDILKVTSVTSAHVLGTNIKPSSSLELSLVSVSTIVTEFYKGNFTFTYVDELCECNAFLQIPSGQ